MLRGQWRPRDNNDEDEDDGAEDDGAEDDGASLPPSSTLHSDDSDGADNDEHNDAKGVEAVSLLSPAVNGDGKAEPEKMSEDNGGNDAVEALTHGVSALGLVPSSVRFGRGGSRGRAGLATRGGRTVARHLGHASHPIQPQQQTQAAATTAAAVVGEASEEIENENENLIDAEDSDVMEQDVIAVADKPPSASARGRRGRGRPGGGGGRGGRGRGGFVPPPPRGGFLSRGAVGRGLPRGVLFNAMRARGRGTLK
jgi:hypothetical protein